MKIEKKTQIDCRRIGTGWPTHCKWLASGLQIDRSRITKLIIYSLTKSKSSKIFPPRRSIVKPMMKQYGNRDLYAFFHIFVISRSTKILIKLNFWLRMYVWRLVKLINCKVILTCPIFTQSSVDLPGLFDPIHRNSEREPKSCDSRLYQQS